MTKEEFILSEMIKYYGKESIIISCTSIVLAIIFSITYFFNGVNGDEGYYATLFVSIGFSILTYIGYIVKRNRIKNGCFGDNIEDVRDLQYFIKKQQRGLYYELFIRFGK